MPIPILPGAVHHLALTVTDVERSVEFYTNVLGFHVVLKFPGRGKLVANNGTVLGLMLAPEPGRALPNDRFNENRVGLDHLCLRVNSRTDLERIARALDARGAYHGPIEEYPAPIGAFTLAFRDPDNIQLELAAPNGRSDLWTNE